MAFRNEQSSESQKKVKKNDVNLVVNLCMSQLFAMILKLFNLITLINENASLILYLNQNIIWKCFEGGLSLINFFKPQILEKSIKVVFLKGLSTFNSFHKFSLALNLIFYTN